MKILLKVGIPALITSLIGLTLSCLVLLLCYIYNSKWFETHNKTYSGLCLFLLLCSGFVIILTIISAYFITKRFMDRKRQLIYLLFTSFLYSLMMLTIFPLSTNLNIICYYMPDSELSPSLSIFVNQVLSIISAIVCDIVCCVKYKFQKKHN